MLLFRTRMLAEGYLQPLLELLFPRRDLPRVLSPANGSIQLHVSNSIALATSCSSCLILENVSSALKLKLRHLKSLSRCATASGSWMQLARATGFSCNEGDKFPVVFWKNPENSRC